MSSLAAAILAVELSPLLALSFLNPLLLWGAGLASVPLIIHILNRRRYRIVHWAAMEFLLKAFKENRRRIRFEQLLLLLLRMAVVALLALLLSRPKASADDFGAFVQSKVHHIIVLDESGSMSEASGAASAFETAKKHVTGRLDALARDRSQDLVTLLRSSSQKPDFFARQATLGFLSEARDLLKRLRPTPDRLDLAACLGRAYEAAKKLPEDEIDKHYLYVISDFRGADLLGAEGKLDENLLKGIRKLDPAKILLSPCGKTADANLAVAGLRLKEAMAIKNQVAHFEVVVENQGGRAPGEVELGFSVDGGSRKARLIPAIGPGERHVEVFRATFKEDGSHFVEADLPTDRIPIDNRRSFSFPVAASAKVLLVDGDPGESEERAETFYLQFALDPLGNAAFGLELMRVDDNEIAEREFDPYDQIILANVATLDDETAKRLDAYVRSGGGLLMFAGDQVDPDTWNKLFWNEGKGLLPAPIGDLDGDIDNATEGIVPSSDRHPMLTDVEAIARTLSLVHVGRWFQTGSERDGIDEGEVPEGTKVVFRVGDEAGPPLVVEKGHGKGRVALCLTTADASWTAWAANPSYVVAVRMALEHLMRREDLAPYNLDARSAFRKTFSAADYYTDVRLAAAVARDEDRIAERGFTAAPRKDQPDLLELIAAPVEGRVWPAAAPYRLALRRGDDTEEPLFFSVAPWEQEGRTEQVDTRRLVGLFPAEMRERVHVIEKTAAQGELLTDEGEIWKYLAYGLLAGLLLETLLAWRFGHR